MKKKSIFSYSIGKTALTLLNADKSLPSPYDWEDVHPETGAVRKHRGGLVGKAGTFNIDGWAAEDLKLICTYGAKEAEVNIVSTAANKKAVTVADFVKDFNTAFASLTGSGIKLKAAKTAVGADYDAEYLKITTEAAGDLPFFAPIGFQGRLAALLGIVGWVTTKEAKSFKDDFEKESGKAVDATSGHGIRCSVKEADKIKGTNITASFATLPSSLFALVTGHTYNEKTGELYIDNAGNPPLIAMRYFVEQYEEGNNTKSSFTRVKAITFPSCQITPQGSEASEDAFGAAELQGSGGDNKRSDLPLKFIKEISSADYTAYVGM